MFKFGNVEMQDLFQRENPAISHLEIMKTEAMLELGNAIYASSREVELSFI